MHGNPRLRLLVLACLLGPPLPCPAEVPRSPILQLTNEGFVAGELKPSDAGLIRWQGAMFASPFEFPLNTISAIHWPPPEKRPRPEGDFLFELSNGDVLFGKLASLDEETITLEAPRFGTLRVERSRVHRIRRWRNGSELVYNGPNGLSEWTASPKETWQGRVGSPSTEQAGSSLRADLGLPEQAAVEFEISWKSKPNFLLALGVDPDYDPGKVEEPSPRDGQAAPARPGFAIDNWENKAEESFQHAFRFEVWDEDLVVLRESETEADLAAIGQIAEGAGRIHLRVYLDQKLGRILVDAADGKRLADLTVPAHDPKAHPGIVLTNIDGDVQLDRLIIGHWKGTALPAVSADRPHVVRNDGSVAFGTVDHFDADARAFVILGESGEARIDEDEVAALTLSPPEQDRERAVRVIYQDGVRLSGDLAKVGEDALELNIPGIAGPLHPPLDGLRSLISLQVDDKPSPPTGSGITARLELEGVDLKGSLEEGEEQTEASCLHWKPLGSGTASPLRHGVSGRIVYKEAKPPEPPKQLPQTPDAAPPQPAPVRFLQRLFSPRKSDQAAARKKAQPMLYLRSGDTIPSDVSKIDDQGVWFVTPLSESTFVPHDKVKAVVLGPERAVTVKLSKSKRERLLTLPRMQQGNPPTHLLRSTNGDYLRGRVVSMDNEALRVEVRLEEKDIPRDLIARIIWLHPEDLTASPATDKPAQPVGKTRVQALRSDGIRLTFAPERFADDTLSGQSDVLGACMVQLEDVDQLLIGDAIEQEAAQLAFGRWKLTEAPEPKVAESGGGTGMESALIGKPAPDFTLELLDGKPFHLAEHKGKVVVLDFWASWCGPCLQSMPQVERVAREFEGRGVELFAVNLQETPDRITPMLERHKLSPTVVLDIDGAVAQKYGATAIPQTVVIDREGHVARLWIGAGPHLEEQLRTALQDLLDGKKEPGPAQDEEVKEGS